MNCVDLFIEAVQRNPQKLAIIHKNEHISYGQLRDEVLRTVTYFKSKGIKAGDRILVFVPMSIDLYRIVLALFSMGATAVFLDEWVNKKRMELCCEIAQCNGFVGGLKARLLGLFSKEIRRIPIKLKLKKLGPITQSVQEVDANTPALITFTTGSTGRPKAANRTHGFLMEQFNALIDEIEPKPTDIDMPVLPIVLFMNLGVGCTSLIADFSMSKPEKADFSLIVSTMEKEKVNRCTASPFFIEQLSRHVLKGNQKLSLQKIFTGGAPVFPKSAVLFQQAFPQSDITIVYGSTEAEPISSIMASELLQHGTFMDKGLAVGKIYAGAEVRIITITEESLYDISEKQFEEIQKMDGEIGEIIVSGQHVLGSYFNSDQAFVRSKIKNGNKLWHRTGDSGFLIGEQLYLTGRHAQLINFQGRNLSPFIIENKVQTIEGVRMGTLLQVKNKLILILELDQEREEIDVSSLDIPYDQIKYVSKIPRDPRHRSKIDYQVLEKMIEVN